jgi:Na+-transporting methylmalonyl-CoA/oxaloacetate decarboxylase beta subunit
MEDIMKKFSNIFLVVAVMLFGWMCAVVSCNFRAMEYAVKYGLRASPYLAIIYAIPFLLGISVCLYFSAPFLKKLASKTMDIIYGIIAIAIGTAAVAIVFFTKRPHRYAIIGGADGPTSVYLSGKVNPWSLIGGIIVGCLFLFVGAVIIIKGNKKEH